MSPEGELSEKDQKRNFTLDVLSSKLRQHYEFFASLSKEELLDFLRSCDSQDFQSGEIIFEEGELDAAWFIVISGRVLIHREEKTMGYIGEGQCFGEIGLLKDAPTRTRRGPRPTPSFCPSSGPFSAITCRPSATRSSNSSPASWPTNSPRSTSRSKTWASRSKRLI